MLSHYTDNENSMIINDTSNGKFYRNSQFIEDESAEKSLIINEIAVEKGISFAD